MRGKAFLAIAAAVVVLSILILSKRIGHREVMIEATATKNPSSSVSAPTAGNRSPATVPVGPQVKVVPALSKPADPEFQRWITDEAQAVDSPRVDSAAKEVEIRKMAARLTKTQSEQLFQTANSPTAPPGEKILSTYLMVEGGLNTREELRAFISSPLKDNGPHEPHSEGEINGIREKSLRIMAIDGLFSQAKTDSQAKAALAKAVADSEDPYIKRYAQDKLNQLER